MQAAPEVLIRADDFIPAALCVRGVDLFLDILAIIFNPPNAKKAGKQYLLQFILLYLWQHLEAFQAAQTG